MAAEPSVVEQAVSRALRDNLGKIQRTAEELHQAVSDLIAACASSRPSNALPSMVRARTSAASLSATLEVLARFVTSALQPAMRSPFEPETLSAPSISAKAAVVPVVNHVSEPVIEPVIEPVVESKLDPVAARATDVEVTRIADPAVARVAEAVVSRVADPVITRIADPVVARVADLVETRVADPVVTRIADPVVTRVADPVVARVVDPVEQLEPAPAHLIEEKPWTAPTPVEESPAAAETHSSGETSPISDIQPPFEMPPITDLVGDFSPAVEPVFLSEPVPVFVHEVVPAAEQVDVPTEQPESEPEEAAHVFSLDSLPPEEQELHRRAFRIAKVSMQDIKMLRPEDVRLGRENKDLCFRLRDDIEKAHKEYDRRFQSIQSHPVDYFYDWMVEILAGGDSQALGGYPYPSPVLRR